jgi:hypothetical protein
VRPELLLSVLRRHLHHLDGPEGLSETGIVFEDRWLGPVPALVARPAAGDPPWPAVLWFHGFTADRHASRPELEAMARAGLLAVGIDAVGHGARRRPDFDPYFGGPKEEFTPRFLDLVARTVAEVPAIFDHLRDTGLRYVEIEGAPHLMGHADWVRVVGEAVEWIEGFLT